MIAFAKDLARLKRQLLELLEKDKEFRRVVMDMLELESIEHDEKFEKLLESLNRHEAQLVELREDMMAGFRRHAEELGRHA